MTCDLTITGPENVDVRVDNHGGRPQAWKNRMSEIIRMKSVEPIMYGVVKIIWLDGFEAVVDLRSIIASGEIFEFLRRTPDLFGDVRLGEFGHDIRWIDNDGDEVDFGSDSLRQRGVRQAEILRLAS